MKSSLLTATGLARAAAVLAAAGLLLTGCAADPTLDENWPEIRQKVVDAQSLRLQMDGEAAPDAEGSGQDSEITAAAADLSGATDDSHLKGTMDMDMGADSVDMEILRLGEEVFLKMAADGDGVPAEMAMFEQLVGDRWMLMPADEADSMAGISLKEIMDDLEADMPAAEAFDGKDLKAEKVELDGQEYLKYALPEEFHDFARTMYVHPEDETLHRLEGTGGEDAEADTTATFSEWNAVQAPERPAEDQIFDMAALQGLTG